MIISVFPIKGNIEFLTVLSGSMEPTIHTGSVVFVKPISEYKVGEIVTFGKNDKNNIPTTHRIVESRVQDGHIFYKTKGDANDSEDSREIAQDDIVGRVYFSIPYLGYAINFVKKPIGLMIAIVVPAVIIIYDQIQRIIKEVEKIKKNKKVEVKNETKHEENN